MRDHPQILLPVSLVIIACYLGWAIISGSVRISIKESISRQDSPREYWHYMRIILIIFAIMLALEIWRFL